MQPKPTHRVDADSLKRIEAALSLALQQVDELRAIARVLSESLLYCNDESRLQEMRNDAGSITTHLTRALSEIHSSISDVHDVIMDVPHTRGAA